MFFSPPAESNKGISIDARLRRAVDQLAGPVPKYARGDEPRTRLNIDVKAAGLSYPRSIATDVTASPATRRGRADTMQACCRHSVKLRPVSFLKRRVKDRRLIARASLHASIV
jgi:hypothetical protein